MVLALKKIINRVQVANWCGPIKRYTETDNWVDVGKINFKETISRNFPNLVKVNNPEHILDATSWHANSTRDIGQFLIPKNLIMIYFIYCFLTNFNCRIDVNFD